MTTVPVLEHWQPVTPDNPPPGEYWTRLTDARGTRNEQRLIRLEGAMHLWFLPGVSCYVYWTPTHWAPIR